MYATYKPVKIPGIGTFNTGWLPYDYVLVGLASDFWSILKMEWVDTDNFGFNT